MRLITPVVLLIGTFLSLQGQEALTNEAIVKLVKAGLGEDMVVSMVKAQPGKYQLGAEDVIDLKKNNVPDRVITAMLERSQAGNLAAHGPGGPAAQPAAPPAGYPTEMGVYHKKGGEWVEVLPEVVNWKTGGVLKSVASAGIVKGDVNGAHSRNSVTTPLEFLIRAGEGVGITEYQLIRMRENRDAREFRTVTGGVLHVSGGATRDLVPFEGKKVASRMFLVTLPNLGAGECGFLPPGAVVSGHASATLGKIYSFRLLE